MDQHFGSRWEQKYSLSPACYRNQRLPPASLTWPLGLYADLLFICRLNMTINEDLKRKLFCHYRLDHHQKPFISYVQSNCASGNGGHIFGQAITRVGKIADFSHKQAKGFGKRAALPNSIFQGLPAPLSHPGWNIRDYRPEVRVL